MKSMVMHLFKLRKRAPLASDEVMKDILDMSALDIDVDAVVDHYKESVRNMMEEGGKKGVLSASDMNDSIKAYNEMSDRPTTLNWEEINKEFGPIFDRHEEMRKEASDQMSAIMSQRAEICEAFFAKHGCNADECEQIIQHGPGGEVLSYRIVRKKWS
jgi:hypothetical protein